MSYSIEDFKFTSDDYIVKQHGKDFTFNLPDYNPDVEWCKANNINPAMDTVPEEHIIKTNRKVKGSFQLYKVVRVGSGIINPTFKEHDIIIVPPGNLYPLDLIKDMFLVKPFNIKGKYVKEEK